MRNDEKGKSGQLQVTNLMNRMTLDRFTWEADYRVACDLTRIQGLRNQACG